MTKEIKAIGMHHYKCEVGGRGGGGKDFLDLGVSSFQEPSGVQDFLPNLQNLCSFSIAMQGSFALHFSIA